MMRDKAVSSRKVESSDYSSKSRSRLSSLKKSIVLGEHKNVYISRPRVLFEIAAIV
jgi:hypothetical protein